MVEIEIRPISRKNGNLNEHCSKILKRIFSAYRSPISISGPGPQRKDRRHGDHSDGLHGGGVHRHRARTNDRFAAGALRAARERGGVDMRGLE